MSKKFYVYIHRRSDDGSVFYVGKGCGYRAFISKSRRSDQWKATAKQHGCDIEFLKVGMSEVCALTLEKIAIHFFRSNREPLVNVFDAGGKSATGFKPSWRRPIVCSNSMQFDSADDAAAWCRTIGFSAINGAHITSCARKERGSAYGFSWWFLGDPAMEYTPRYYRSSINSSKSVAVMCSNGMVFHSRGSAAKWCRNNGNPKAHQSAISAVCLGKMSYAYGHVWRSVNG